MGKFILVIMCIIIGVLDLILGLKLKSSIDDLHSNRVSHYNFVGDGGGTYNDYEKNSRVKLWLAFILSSITEAGLVIFTVAKIFLIES